MQRSRTWGLSAVAAAVAGVLIAVSLTGPAVAEESTFPDVPPSHRFYNEIEFLVAAGITQGYDDGTYRPDNAVNRGSMAAFLYRLAAEDDYTPPATPTFPDVPTNHLFYTEIEWLSENGITTGYEDGLYRPSNAVNRGSMAAFLYRTAEQPEFSSPTTPSFPDVPASHLFFDEVEWLKSTEITEGYADGTYKPGNLVNRGSMAAFLTRLAFWAVSEVPLEMLSVTPEGYAGGGWSGGVSLSASGEVAAFASTAEDLVDGDTNHTQDVFVRDVASGVTERISVASDESQANGGSHVASISEDGRYVTFVSEATNLVSGDTNGVADVFRRDRSAGVTVRVSVGAGGTQANAASSEASVSGNGQVVVFSSTASNLVASDANGLQDVFVRDLAAGVTERVSVSSLATEGDGPSDQPSVSDDGSVVSFQSRASTFAAGDVAGTPDVFVHDRASDVTAIVSAAPSGAPANSSSLQSVISGNGRYVMLQSFASDLKPGIPVDGWHLYRRDLWTGAVDLIDLSPVGTPSSGYSELGSISDDGDVVTFWSYGKDLVADWAVTGVGDVYLRDMSTGVTELVSAGFDGSVGNDYSAVGQGAVSDDGRFVGFASGASNLVPGDDNDDWDVFLLDLGAE